MKIAWFISNHGYGHIMRNSPLILEALSHPEVEKIVVVCASSHLEVLKRYIRSPKVELIPFEKTDYGVEVIQGTLLMDVPKMKQEVAAYIADFDRRAGWTEELLRTKEIDRAVVDMPVWALQGAKQAGVPSILITNFTWIEEYEEVLPEALILPFRERYHLADRVLLYDLANPRIRAIFPQGERVGLTARAFDPQKVAAIRAEHTRPIVFCSIGLSNSGLKHPLETEGLPYDFITTPELEMRGSNVFRLQGNEDMQNYAAAADYSISKAGWGTIAEMLLAGTPMALLGRDTVPEDRMNIDELEYRHAGIKVQVEELRNMGAVMERLHRFAAEEFVAGQYTDNRKKIVECIMK